MVSNEYTLIMWEVPPVIKIYEALGAVADGRLEVLGNTAKCYSSSGNKFYDISYSPEERAIMANDNGSYWQNHLGYPAVAFLLQTGVLAYKEDLAIYFKDVAWKDLNQKFNNNFDKTVEYIFANIEDDKIREIESYANGLLKDIELLNLTMLGKKQKPPTGY